MIIYRQFKEEERKKGERSFRFLKPLYRTEALARG
jgi:hypothetical protein